MDSLGKLAEARIRQWQQRADKAEPATAVDRTFESLEAQLLRELLTLRARIGEARSEADRKAMQAEANKLQVRLMILLEQSGRPLAARMLDERLATPAQKRAD